MTTSKNLGLNLPSRDNTTDLADINVISENFETIDNEFENVYNKLNNTGVINTVSGNPVVLKDSVNAPLKNLKLFGKTTQNGTPTPDAPVPLVSVGDSGSFTVKIQGENVEEQSLTMPYNLRSVPNTDFKDETDFNKGIVTENTIKFTFNGSENWQTHSYGFILYNSSVSIKTQRCVCDKYKFVYWLDLAKSDYGICATDMNSRFICIHDKDCSTLEEFKTKLANNPITVICVRATPIETSISESELNAYKQLYTNKGNTTFISEANMEVSYVADTKLYIDNKIAELTALTLEG